MAQRQSARLMIERLQVQIQPGARFFSSHSLSIVSFKRALKEVKYSSFSIKQLQLGAHCALGKNITLLYLGKNGTGSELTIA